jgi:protoheme IX farnesyltransferase
VTIPDPSPTNHPAPDGGAPVPNVLAALVEVDAERTLIAHWAELLRVRIAAMVVLTALLGAWLAEPSARGLVRGVEAALYVLLVTASASILNQVLERDTDRMMTRTRRRPLVTGDISVATALWTALLTAALGTIGLATRFNLLSAVLLLATLVSYVAIYTPMKRVSTLNTAFGAIPGAAPPLIAYAALAGHVGPWAWAVFGVLYVWQFPHFMAIAWRCREDYARAGHRMVAAVPGSEGMAGRQALVYSLAIVPVSMLPAMWGMAGLVYVIGALLLGLSYIVPSARFAIREDAPRARALLIASLFYLPLYFALVLIDPVVRG